VKKIKLAIFTIAILLMCSGVAYAGWTEQIELAVSMKTAVTELQIEDVQAKGARVDTTAQNQAAIFVKEIQPGECAEIDITFVNTGTIPLDIVDVVISRVGGYSSVNKEALTISLSASVNGKSLFNNSKQVSHWKTNGDVKIKGLAEVPVGGTVIIRVQVTFEEDEKKDKEDKEDKGKPDKEDKEDKGKPDKEDKGKPDKEDKKDKDDKDKEEKVFENVTFIISPEYTRFNED
jgi:hypothetical protein